MGCGSSSVNQNAGSYPKAGGSDGYQGGDNTDYGQRQQSDTYPKQGGGGGYSQQHGNQVYPNGGAGRNDGYQGGDNTDHGQREQSETYPKQGGGGGYHNDNNMDNSQQHENHINPAPAPEENKPEPITDEELRRRWRPHPAEDEDDEPEESEVTEMKNTEGMFRLGRIRNVIDRRSRSPRDDVRSERPLTNTLWTDESFPAAVAMAGCDGHVSWRRPHEICENPCLFSEGTTRFDIGQGSAGTCWFLSILASLADKPDVIKEIIPEDSYRLGSHDYDGVFHCRFWRFGEWQDVYIDDCLPILQNGQTPWGARSATDPNEMWVSLIEKAFAKFHGSYQQVFGGWAGDAYIALTGGVAERIQLKDTTPRELFPRLKNAITSGSVITCNVPEDKDGQFGLVGNHAYTLTGAIKVMFRGKTLPLLRIRNPWGKGKGEWTGPWGDDSTVWNEVSEELKAKLKFTDHEDGEFWMPLTDFFKYYLEAHLCNFTPDFDQDGIPDGLDNVMVVFDEWMGDKAAGRLVDEKFRNPKMRFSVTEENLDSDGLAPVVVQLIQAKKRRQDKDLVYIRADFYKVECDENGKLLLTELTNFENYYGGPDYSYRYRVEPGDYVIVPSTFEAGQERSFCVRVFSAEATIAREIEAGSSLFVGQGDNGFEKDGQSFLTPVLAHKMLGQWVSGVNAGGQISNKTYHTNPQYFVTVRGDNPQPVMVSVILENMKPKIAFGIKVYKVSSSDPLPLDLSYLHNHHGSAIPNADGKQIFVISYDVVGNYVLDPGYYVILLHTDKPDTEKAYYLSLSCQEQNSIGCTSYNTSN